MCHRELLGRNKLTANGGRKLITQRSHNPQTGPNPGATADPVYPNNTEKGVVVGVGVRDISTPPTKNNTLVSKLRNELTRRGISNPDSFLDALDADAIEGAIRWWDDERKVNTIGAALLAHKLQNGGMAGYDPPDSKPKWNRPEDEARRASENSSYAAKHLRYKSIIDALPEHPTSVVIRRCEGFSKPTVENVRRSLGASPLDAA